jgi:hypothetical protein
LLVASPRELRLGRVCSIIARSGIARPSLQGSYVYSSPQKYLCRMERKCLCWLSCITPEMPRSGRKCR